MATEKERPVKRKRDKDLRHDMKRVSYVLTTMRD